MARLLTSNATRAEHCDIDVHLALMHLVRKNLLDSCADEWRHHGIGCLQSYVKEGSEKESRIHIWHPDLVLSGMAENGAIHSHRFSLKSWVLAGCLAHSEYLPFEDIDGKYYEYNLVNARSSLEISGSYHTLPEKVSNRSYQVGINRHTFEAGDVYTFLKGAYHSSRPLGGTCVTFVSMGQKTGSARLLAREDMPIRHAFGNSENITRPERIMDYVGLGIRALEAELERE